MEEYTPQASRRTLFIGIGIAIGLIFFISLVSIVLFGGNKGGNGSLGQSSSGVTTETKAKQALSDAEKDLKRSADEQAAAKAALKDADNQIKVGN